MFPYNKKFFFSLQKVIISFVLQINFFVYRHKQISSAQYNDENHDGYDTLNQHH